MKGAMKSALRLAWSEAAEAVSAEIKHLTGIDISCVARYDDEFFWTVHFPYERMPVKTLNRLLYAADADEKIRFDSLPSDEEGYTSVNSIGMLLSEELLSRHLKRRWEHIAIFEDALWLVGVTAPEGDSVCRVMSISEMELELGKLKSKGELIEYMRDNGASHSSLMDFCGEYRDTYHNELCRSYPIPDGKHPGLFLVLVKEGILSLPYDDANGEEYELFDLEDARLFSCANDMEELIRSWLDFDAGLCRTMIDMRKYLMEQEAVNVPEN